MKLLSKVLLWSGVMLALAPEIHAQASGGGVDRKGERTITDSSEKANYSEGEQTNITKIGDLFRKIGFVPDDRNNYFFVQLSDIHIYAEDQANPDAKNIFNTDLAADLVNLLGEINGMAPPPSCVIITGDLVHDAQAKQFERLKQLLQKLDSRVPAFLAPGNHDANRGQFKQVFPDRQPYFSFDRGEWHFVTLDSRGDGSFDKAQSEWLAGDLKGTKLSHVIFFTHIPMIYQEGWEDVRAMRERICMLAGQYGKDAWIFSGHLHFNFLARCRYENMAAVNLVVTTSSTRTFGHEAPGYRLVCVEADRIKATVFKRVGATCGFRIDPLPERWPVYIPPPFEPARTELLSFEVPDDEGYVSRSEGVGLKDNYRFVDAKGVLVYAIPVDFPVKNLTLRVSIGSDYVVEASPDNKNYREIFRSAARTPRSKLEWKIPEEDRRGTLYLKITDRTPEDGMGAFVYGVSVSGGK
jgi:calcineurin-like phosphoesterase family protein